MSRAADIAFWHEVNRTIGLTGVVERLANRVRSTDRLDLAREMIANADELAVRAHSDELAPRPARQTDEVAVARLEGHAPGWREAAATLRTRRN